MEDIEVKIKQAMLQRQNDISKVKQIMFEKLKEMAEIEVEDCMDGCDYANICSIMNEIAKTLLNK